MRAIGYCRVSSTAQETGLSLDDQARRVTQAAEGRGWDMLTVRRDVGSGKQVNDNLRRTLHDLDSGVFDVIVVARLDRLSRSVGDFANLMDRASKKGWSILCLDPEVDLTTPFGRAMAGVAAVFAQLERELISQRQRESIAARKAAGTWVYNHPYRRIPEGAAKRIADLAVMPGWGFTAIRNQLVLEGYGDIQERTIYRHMAAARAAHAQRKRSKA